MEKYTVTGMSCAACSARVEKAVSSLDGVTSCSVNLLTNSMTVEGNANEDIIINAVENAGYSAFRQGSEPKVNDTEEKTLKERLIYSVIFLIILMYFSMGVTMWDFPLPSFLRENFVALGLIQLLLSVIVMIINQKFFINGFKSLLKKAPNMDTLVALGSSASFVYSTYALFLLTADPANHKYIHEFYFESAAMILALITVGKMLEAHSKGKTTDALKSLMALAPKTATILKDGKEIQIPADKLKKGDIFIVRPGGSIPTDGIILDGDCAIDESALTGESIPVDKNPGDTVSAATINKSGYIKCEATRVGEDTALSQIIKMVSDASASKAPIAKAADKVSGVFVPIVILFSVITTLIWLFSGADAGFSIARGISVLVISCPCALGLATPVAIMVGNGIGAKNGILFKNAVSLEETGKIKIVALDKTGTITKGTPEVTDIIPYSDTASNELLTLAYSLEIKSEHPIAKAIVRKCEEMELSPKPTENFKAVSGNGLFAILDNHPCHGGNMKYISENTQIPDDIIKLSDSLAEQGKTPLYFSYNGKFKGIIAIADAIKPHSNEAIAELKKMGIHVVMLTGDNEKTANAVKKNTGIDEVIAGVLPDGKERVIRELKSKGKVAMVGDGINDAPALTSADIGIAIGAGTDVAIDAADIVLVKSTLSDVPAAIRLSRATLKNIHQNLFWAFLYNSVGIPLAAGALIPVFGLQLNPMFAAAAMSLSSFCVVSNALRLNLIKIKENKKEKKTMEITMKIEGMMCMHCEARVKKTLESIDGVAEAIPSHEQNTAVVKLEKDVSFDVLKAAVEEQGYTVIE